MAGYGRNVPVLKEFEPKSITIIDILQDHITAAEDKHKSITAVCAPLHDWIGQNYRERYDVVVGVWALSYMQEAHVDRLLGWCKMKVKILVLIEPVHTDWDQIDANQERWLDVGQ